MLSRFQEEIVERFRPLLARLDRSMVTDDSGLSIVESGSGWAVKVTVEARGHQVPGLHVFATSRQCTLGFADSEILECHRDPGSDASLVTELMRLATRYLLGTTVVEHRNVRGKLVMVEYFYGIDSETTRACRIGSSHLLAWPRKMERTFKRSHRFTRKDLAGEQ
jgi:hypothetical protein